MNSRQISECVKELIDKAVREYAEDVLDYLEADWNYNTYPTEEHDKKIYFKGYGDFYTIAKRCVEVALEGYTKR